MIPENIIKEVVSRTDIVAVVQRYVALKKMGTSYKACCPFHQEKTPSFHVSPGNNSFYCFGCHKGGNVVTFMMEIEKKNFPETIEGLAADLGLRWEKQSVESPQQQALHQSEKLQVQKMISVSRMACKVFYQNLRNASPEQQAALAYLNKRGIPTEILDRFGIGLAKNTWDDLKNHFHKQNIPFAIAHDLGLLSLAPREDLKQNAAADNKALHYYDKFRNRIIFPIQNEKNEVIGFGGRILDNTEPKYLNSATSLIFEKSQTLFNFNRSKQKIREQDQVILVEGYMDCITLVQFGIENVVAPLGTSLTEKHIQKLKSVSENFVLVFDGDAPGIKAAYHALDLCLPHSIFPKMILLPDKLDPDDYIKLKGKDSFLKLLREAPDSLEKYFVEGLKNQFQDHQSRKQFLDEASTKLSKIKDKIALTLRIKFLADVCNIDGKILKEIVEDKKKSGLRINKGANLMMDPLLAKANETSPAIKVITNNLANSLAGPVKENSNVRFRVGLANTQGASLLTNRLKQNLLGNNSEGFKAIIISWVEHLLLSPQLWHKLPAHWHKKFTSEEKQFAPVKLLLWWHQKIKAEQMEQCLEIIANPFATIKQDERTKIDPEKLNPEKITWGQKWVPPLMKWVLDSFEKISDPEIKELVSRYSIRDPFNRSTEEIERAWILLVKKWQLHLLRRQKEIKLMELKLLESQLSIIPVDKDAQIQVMLQELDIVSKQIDQFNRDHALSVPAR